MRQVLDARRVSDDRLVAIKCIENATSEAVLNELAITEYLGSGDLAKDPCNHSVPFIETLRNPAEPDCVFLVEDWFRPCYLYKYYHVGEGIEFMRQVLEVCIYQFSCIC